MKLILEVTDSLQEKSAVPGESAGHLRTPEGFAALGVPC